MPPEPDLINAMEAECNAVADDIAGQIVANIRRLESENARLRAAVAVLRNMVLDSVLPEAIAIERCIVRNGAQDIHCIGNSAIKMQNEINAALSVTEQYKEPTT